MRFNFVELSKDTHSRHSYTDPAFVFLLRASHSRVTHPMSSYVKRERSMPALSVHSPLQIDPPTHYVEPGCSLIADFFMEALLLLVLL